VRQQERATKSIEPEREIPDWPEIPAEVIARFPSMGEYQLKQAKVWNLLMLLLREMRNGET